MSIPNEPLPTADPSRCWEGTDLPLASRIIRCLLDGHSIPDTADLCSTTPHTVMAVRRRHSLPRNRPLRPDSYEERTALRLLIFTRLDPAPLTALLSQAAPRLRALLTRTIDPSDPTGWEGTS